MRMAGSWRLIAALMLVLLALPPPCATAAKKKRGKDPVETPPAASEEEVQGTPIAIPPRKTLTYFSSVDPEALAGVEIGSPDSIRSAVSILRRHSAGYTENEKVLLAVAASVLQLVWPQEVFAVDVPPVTAVTPYLGAIDSARQGVYDTSTGNVDFLTLVLPSLVLVTSQTRRDYYAESETALTKALSLRGNSVLARYLLGKLYARQERWTEAADAFATAYGAAPQVIECAYAYVEALLKAGHAQQSFLLAQQLQLQRPQDMQLLRLTAQAAYDAGDLAAAEQYVVRVLQLEPDDAAFVLFRARILVQNGDYIKAASLLDVYARADTTARDYLELRARVQKDWNRNISAATRTIEQALALYPGDTKIVLAAAELAAETGADVGGRSAEELAAQILAVEPQNVQALAIQVSALVQRKDWARAYAASTELLSLDPNGALDTHIDICLESGNEREAWQLAQQQYAERPQDEVVIQTYIKVLVATNRTEEARRLIEQLLPTAATPMKSFLYYERSFLSSDEDTIFGDLRSSLTANPRNKDALYRLYSIYYRKKEYRKAQYYLKQVVALSPNDASLQALAQELDELLRR